MASPFSSASFLAGRSKLRSVVVKNDDGGTNEVAAKLAEGIALERDQNARLRAVDMEAWYDYIPQHTFRTVFVPLSAAEARAMVACYWAKKKQDGLCKDVTNRDGSCMEEQEQQLAGLESRIAAALPPLLTGTGKGVFVKLSSRSPKDSRWSQARSFELICAQLTALRAAGQVVDNNAIVATIMSATIQSLKVSSAAQIMDCFLTSDRVCEDDLPLALNFPSSWSQHIVLREWVMIPTHLEFRAFVFDRKMTALCQYYNGAFFPELEVEKDRILSIVQTCFDQIKNVLPIDPPEYSMDVAVSLDENKAYIVELNPFGKPDGLGTGTALFDNKDARDLRILFGEAPLEFRLENSDRRSAVNAEADQVVQGPLRTWLQVNGYFAGNS